MFGNEFDRYAGTDQQRGVLAESGEKLLCQTDGSRGDGYGVGADFCVGADFLRDRKCVLKQAAKVLAHCACILCGTVRVLELPENLSFTEHHGIEAAGDAENMANRLIGIKPEQ